MPLLIRRIAWFLKPLVSPASGASIVFIIAVVVCHGVVSHSGHSGLDAVVDWWMACLLVIAIVGAIFMAYFLLWLAVSLILYRWKRSAEEVKC